MRREASYVPTPVHGANVLCTLEARFSYKDQEKGSLIQLMRPSFSWDLPLFLMCVVHHVHLTHFCKMYSDLLAAGITFHCMKW